MDQLQSNSTQFSEEQKNQELENNQIQLIQIQRLPREVLKQELQLRKFINEQRTICISKPQYAYNCGINSVTSCWNYLFSTLGNGQEEPITQELAMIINGYGQNVFYNQSFNPGNQVLQKWFMKLCEYKGVKGKCDFFWKKNGAGKTNLSDEQALNKLKKGLKCKNTALVYHIDNHYTVPVGYDQSPRDPKYTLTKQISDLQYDEIQTDILVGDQALLPNSPPIFTIDFQKMALDLGMKYPYYYSAKLDELKIKPQSKKEFYEGGREFKGNRHCILGFYKVNQQNTDNYEGQNQVNQLLIQQQQNQSQNQNQDCNIL